MNQQEAVTRTGNVDMNIDEYVNRFGVDVATAMTHLMLISMIEKVTPHEQHRQWLFKLLLQSVDEQKFAAAALLWAQELVAMAAAETPEPDSAEEMT